MITSHLLLQLVMAAHTTCASADTTDVPRFFSQFMTSLSANERVSRGAFVLVCGDRVAFASGFGKALNGSAVDPERTLFRAASNSKLVVATAAMQLAVNGTWKLTDDVNRYLPPASQLDSGFARNVTIADLLTHKAGFEDKFAGGIAQTSDRISLAEYFARNRPRRVRPAGAEVSYSNAGMALLGYAVEVASKQPFAEYAATHVFAPLGMTRSTFAQPIPSAWQAELASAPPKGARDVVFLPYPAASLVTTPSDMGRFIVAHLSRPSVPGGAYGFFDGEMNGRRTLFHTGDSGDHSVVLLLPGERVGLYFVFSGSDEQTVVREKLVHAFMDRYFPNTTPPTTIAGTQPLGELTGTFRGAAYSRSNYEKLKAMFYQAIVRDGGNGTLQIVPPGGGAPVTVKRRAPDVFAGDSGEVITFRRSVSGAAVGFTLSGSIWDPQSFDRIGLLEDGRLHLAAFALGALAFLARLFFVPVAAVARRIGHRPKPGYSANERKWWRWSGIVSALALITPVVGLGVAFLSFRPGAVAIPRAAFVVGVWLTIVVLVGLPLAPVTIQAWRQHYWSSVRRVLFTAVAASVIVGAPLLAYWKALPF